MWERPGIQVHLDYAPYVASRNHWGQLAQRIVDKDTEGSHMNSHFRLGNKESEL